MLADFDICHQIASLRNCTFHYLDLDLLFERNVNISKAVGARSEIASDVLEMLAFAIERQTLRKLHSMIRTYFLIKTI